MMIVKERMRMRMRCMGEGGYCRYVNKRVGVWASLKEKAGRVWLKGAIMPGWEERVSMSVGLSILYNVYLAGRVVRISRLCGNEIWETKIKSSCGKLCVCTCV